MGVTESLSRGREVFARRAGATLLALFGVLLAIDLAMKLAGIEVWIFGGNLSFGGLRSNIWNGIGVGLVLGLGGIGLSMTYSILTFANFSHGDLLTLGGFTGWGVAFLVAAWGSVPASLLILVRPGGESSPGIIGAHVAATPLAVLLGLVVAAAFTALAAVAIDRLVYKPMRDRSGIALLIASIGVALALRYLIVFFYGTRNRGVTASVGTGVVDSTLGVGSYLIGFRGTSVGIFQQETIEGNLQTATVWSLNTHRVTVVVAAVVLMVGMHLLLQRTKLGTAMRAMADNKDLALITGIPTERIVTATWILGAGMAGAAGYLMVMFQGAIAFDFGWQLLLLVFAAVILGGIGSIYGAIAGGLVIGLVFSMSTLWIPSDFNEAAAFLAMILALLYRPEGLFGGITTA